MQPYKGTDMDRAPESGSIGHGATVRVIFWTFQLTAGGSWLNLGRHRQQFTAGSALVARHLIFATGRLGEDAAGYYDRKGGPTRVKGG